MNIKNKEDQMSSRLGNLDQYKFRLCLNGKPVLIRFGEEETDVKETIRDHRHITNLKVGLMNLIPRP